MNLSGQAVQEVYLTFQCRTKSFEKLRQGGFIFTKKLKIHVKAVSLYQGVEIKLEGIFPVKIIVRIQIKVCWQFEAKIVPEQYVCLTSYFKFS